MRARPGIVSAHLLQTSFASGGFDVAHYRFAAAQKFDWSRSFQPNALELCLNLEGTGTLGEQGSKITLSLRNVAVYSTEAPAPFFAWRESAQPHHFVIIRFNRDYLNQKVAQNGPAMKDDVRSFLDASQPRGRSLSFAWVEPMSIGVQNLTHALIDPPVVGAAAQAFWYEAKALELTALFLLKPSVNEEGAPDFFCAQQKTLTKQRVNQACALLERDLGNPPTLEMLANEIGCGAFHLSRIFSQHTGMTIPQYLRQLRLEKAAEMLRAGQCNVTEAAFAVGYRSLSHFSKAFWETFGCCPGLYGNPKLVRGSRRSAGLGVQY